LVRSASISYCATKISPQNVRDVTKYVTKCKLREKHSALKAKNPKEKSPETIMFQGFHIGTPGAIRTHDLQSRSSPEGALWMQHTPPIGERLFFTGSNSMP